MESFQPVDVKTSADRNNANSVLSDARRKPPINELKAPYVAVIVGTVF